MPAPSPEAQPGPMPEAQFDALMQRAGLVLTAAQRDSLLAASRHVVAATAQLRPRGGVSVEPATVFAPKAPVA
ncbi:hypothetical protein [Falsiroseomonas selenitidurans]|uniref:Uncharacterized protein n=1 Tax=Falsiroseomonas selenitidurans TaxID=2716335 RepID=A0ABX1EAQ2_9PROT|nr:hypothetical protein [Falsiroseomonas selenitidurans]NKC34292.1 hypothetical protein [Falsiroseomonas selenitidurans]